MSQDIQNSKSKFFYTYLLRIKAAIWGSKKRKIFFVVSTAIVIAAVLPATRYWFSSFLVKKEVSFIVYDSVSGGVVQDAEVIVGRDIYSTTDTGLLNIKKLRTGTSTVIISKPFYKTFKTKINVPIFGTVKQQTITLQASGQVVKAQVLNRLSNAPLEGVSIRSTKGGNAKTNRDGIAVLVLPKNVESSEATLSGDMVVTQKVILHAANDSLTNTFKATPKGRVYFLDRTKGRVDVIKTNLDGTDKQVAIEGTGYEQLSDTVLVPSNDWQYVAYKARHTSVVPSLYIISTSDDVLKTIFEDASAVTPVGWVGDYFVYKEDTSQIVWANNRTILKSYNAKTGVTTILDRTRAEGGSVLDFAGEFFGDIYLMHDKIVYTKYWTASYYYGSRLADKRMAVVETKPDSSTPRTVRVWQAGYNAFIRTVQHVPDSFYVYIRLDGVLNSFWTFASGEVSENTTIDEASFTNTTYPTYKLSPNGAFASWLGVKNNRKNLLIGDSSAQNAKSLAETDSYVPYGWYSNDYILLQNKNNELFIIGRDGIRAGDAPIKVGNFAKQNSKFAGYGN